MERKVCPNATPARGGVRRDEGQAGLAAATGSGRRDKAVRRLVAEGRN